MKKSSLKWGMVLGMLVLLLGMSQNAQACAYPKCSISIKPGDILINFSEPKMLSTSGSVYQYSYSANIPAGNYQVMLEAYDGYVGREKVSQPNERYFVKFMNGGSEMAKSGSTGDVPDMVQEATWKGAVNEKISLNSKADKVITYHSVYPDNSSPNSVSAVCMALRPILEKIDGKCGNADGQTFENKPSENLCEKGTASSVSLEEEKFIWTCSGTNGGAEDSCEAFKKKEVSDPVCGNKIIETGEQCDDGNILNGDGCSSLCMLEKKEEPKEEEEEDEEEEDCDGTIGDFVWNDLNKNGVQDANEPGLSDIKVTLKSGDDEWETHTNKYGKYKFEDLCEGEYSVKVKELDVIAYKQTYDPDGTLNHKTDVKLKGSDDSHKKADFGYAGKTLPKTGAGSIALVISGLISAVGAVSFKKFKKNQA